MPRAVFAATSRRITSPRPCSHRFISCISRGGSIMKWNLVGRSLAGLVAAALSTLVLAQAPVEISFYYPVAVGGPITKIVDGLAADFEKENPGIKVKPIYAGTYQ